MTNRLGRRLACAILASLPLFAQAATPIFGYTEKRHDTVNPKLFPKWSGMATRAHKDAQKLSNCKPDFFNRCFQNELQRLLPAIRKQSQLDQVRSINRFVNKMTYASDSSNWGQRDYWAARWEFYGKDKGDCEDYAIAKYYTLKELGFPVSSMRVVAVRDTNLKLGHAILSVTLNNTNWILDNRVKKIQPDRKVVHYQPVYSINENHWWRHFPRR